MKKNYIAPEMTADIFATDDQFMNIASLQVYEEEVDEGYAPAEEWSYWVVL